MSPLSRSKRQRMTAQQRREQIVTEAMALFARDGFAGTTTQRIARRCGVSEALLFRFFRDKSSLYSAIIDRKIAETEGQLFPLEAARRHDDVEVFRTIGSVLIKAMTRDPSFMRLLLYSGLEEHAMSEMFYRARVAKLFSFLEKYIRQRVRQGAFRCAKPALIARTFVGMLVNHMLNREVFRYEASRKARSKEIVDELVGFTLRGLRA